MSAMSVSAWSPATIAASSEEIRAVFAAAFVMSADEASRFVGHLATHATRRDFRFIAACEGENGPLLGFIYGYTGEPGQWFHDRIRAALAPAMAEHWLADVYEVVEFGVRPEAQGRGIGGQLHDALVSSLTNRTAILSTRQEDTPARRLYQRRGWQPLLTDYQFPSSAKPYTILGLDLRQAATEHKPVTRSL